MTSDSVIEEAAKALTGLTDAEWAIATAEGTDHLTGYFEAATRCLAVFEKAHAATGDEREELAAAVLEAAVWPEKVMRAPSGSEFAFVDRLLASGVWGFRRPVSPEPQDEGYAEFENWEQEMFRHQPVLSMADGAIVGCQCLDRVFMKGREDWGTHLASVITARLSAQVPEPQAEPTEHLDHYADPNDPFWQSRPEPVTQGEPSDAQALELDPQPWVFVSDQVFGVRSATDKGFHSVSGAYYVFQPRSGYEQDRARYEKGEAT